MRRFGGAFFGSLFVAAFVVTAVSAQTSLGRVRGRVSDADGVIANAIVRLTDESNGVKRATTSNDAGEYLFADVPPGRYTVRASRDGYGPIEYRGLIVGTSGSAICDLHMSPGAIEAFISAESPAPDRVNGILSTAFTRDDLISQPTAGRNIFIMGTLAPTVLPTGNAVFVRQQDQSNASLISMAGSSRRANTYVVDGVPIVDIQNRATIIPGMESVDEMRVQLGPYDPQVGRTAGGVFNVTAKSGGNEWSGSAVYQNRPDAMQAQLFFADKAGLPRVDTSYHLFAGSVGGRIVRDRTFFFLSGEGYRTESSRNTVLNLPTAAERRGDFSDSAVTIFDPLSTRPDPLAPGRFIRDPFPGNRIPTARLNPVAVAMLAHVPAAGLNASVPVSVGVLDEARQLSGKLAHQWNARLNTSMTYAWYRSAEPDARFYGGNLFANGADPGDGALVRRVNMLAINHTWSVNDRTGIHARYGMNEFLDDNRGADFDPASLGFDPRFLASVPFRKFPSIYVSDYGQGGALLGDRDRQRGLFYAHNASAVVTTLRGRHTWQAGGEWRRTGVDFRNLGGSGYFGFTRDFTNGPDPIAAANATGNALASFLLGYPANGGIYTSVPIDVYVRYGAGFVQDTIRVGTRFTVSLGLRYEFEDGLREADNHLAVGWSTAPFPIQVAANRQDGTPLRLTGGLIYAGEGGAPTMQGDPDRWKPSPRVNAAFMTDDRGVLRAGYGIFRAPQQGISASETGTGTRGYNVTTNLVTTLENRFIPCATCSLTFPFPDGVAQPSGSALGVMTGVGGGVEFVDPRSTPGHYHRYSIEFERRFFSSVTINAAYAGAVGTNLSVGGSSGSFVNVNQLEPRYSTLGAGLFAPVANPFFGTPLAVGILAGATIPAGQLLRPYPQFDAVYAMRSALARSRYDALIVGASQHRSRWWLRGNYTFSRQRDNQFAESNFFSEGSAIRNYYDIESEYGLSVLDTPHRLNAAGSIALPARFSASFAMTYQSGFPIAIGQAAQNSGLLAGSQRPNVVPGASPLLATDPVDAFDASCSCIKWLNPSAWTEAPAFTLGNAPRADERARTPGRRLLDVAIDRPFRYGRTSLTLRAEIINVLNARDFRGPNSQWGSSTFGEIRSDSGFPRTLQLRARVAW
ncbi:MAG: TonB-dependent receptor [Cyanobacteria bacterium]|nr:TonB-dependent receptor [Cyanobacteriota bacterium]